MVYRLSWAAAIGGMVLALMRLNALVRGSTEGAPWQVVVLAGALLGAVITWTVVAYRLSNTVLVVANLAALAITATRVAVPDTTAFLLPTFESVRALRVELGYAFEVIRTGVAPVIPASGLVVVITAVFWGLGALLVWGLLTGRPYVALVPPVVVYLQLATADRGFAGIGWTLAFLALLGGSLAAVTLDERSAGTGRLTRTRRSSSAGGVISSGSLVTIAAAVVLTLITSSALASAVPSTGVLEWRNPSGLTGGYYGSISYNPFISIQKSLVSQSDTPVFTARVAGDVPGDRLYWRLLTMDTFNGVYWYANSPRVVSPNDGPFEDPSQSFAGPTTQVVQDITIQQLRNDWLPAVYAPQAMVSDNRQVERGYRVASDGSLRFGSLSFRGMRYQVVSDVPVPEIGALAVDENGQPTQAFADAVAAGDLELPAAPVVPRSQPSSRYTDLPADLDPRIVELAQAITDGLESDYERALALESYFRSSANGFRYAIEVPAGEDSADLADWLFNAENANYRRGYCEQYATSLGVMARAVGIPSRVVLGFTPGQRLGDGTIVVLDRNAHSWVEMWMPAQGWVRFDSTPRNDGVNPSAMSELPFDIQDFLVPLAIESPLIETADLPGPILEPLDEPPERAPVGGSDPIAERTFSLPPWLGNVAVIVGALAVALGAVPAVKWWRRRRRLARLRRGDISAAWREIVARLTDLGEDVRPSMTPLEVAGETDRALVPLAAVYTESVYGPGGSVGEARTRAAADSFSATEASFSMKYSPARRLAAVYRLRSLLPGRLRRRRR